MENKHAFHALHPKVSALAARNYGLVTREQLIDLGLDRGAIGHQLKIGGLIIIHRGVYAVHYRRREPEVAAAAAVMAGGPGAVLSHFSAAALWGLTRRWPSVPEITVPTDRRTTGITIHRSRILTQADITRQLGIPTTSPARTLLDISTGLSPRARARAVNDGRLSRFLHPDDLRELLPRVPNHPGRALLAEFAHDLPTGPTRSQFEDAFRDFVRRHGLPEPRVNTRVAGYEVDILFAAERVIIELDGWEHHQSRQAFERDRERDAATLAAGYITVRVTWSRLTQRPGREAARLRDILQARRPTTTPAEAHVARASGRSDGSTPARSG